MHIAVITEYNPFHMGHEYQLNELRRAFPDACITAVMGGIFSQRGEAYITTPYVRAEAALVCGADLCLELPFPFSCAPAKVFARAGVEIAAKIGADMLAFGSECGDIGMLEKMLARLDSAEMQKALQSMDSSALGKTRAYAKAYKDLYGEDVSDKPNDILALEYLRAIKGGGYPIKPYTIKRVGDFKSGEGRFASATSMRSDFEKSGFASLCKNVPPAAAEVYKKAYASGLFGARFEKLSSAVLLKLHSANGGTAFSGGGLLNHIKASAKDAGSIKELAEKAATKRYTTAEISRCILFSLFDIAKEDIDAPVYYTKLLAANERGRKVLGSRHDIEIITKPSAAHFLSENAKAQYEKTFTAERAFALCFDGKYNHLTQTPIII